MTKVRHILQEEWELLQKFKEMKPLDEETIVGIRMTTEGDIIAFVRAIEKAHGIE